MPVRATLRQDWAGSEGRRNQVVPGPFPARHSYVVVISVERWSDGVTIHSAAPLPERDGGGDPPWASRLKDDARTAYSQSRGWRWGRRPPHPDEVLVCALDPPRSEDALDHGHGSEIDVDLAETLGDPP